MGLLQMTGWKRVPAEATPSDAAGESVAAPTCPKVGGAAAGGSGWTLALICAGMGMIACCVLIPQAERNRVLLYQCEKLTSDLAHVQKRLALHEAFVSELGRDPLLAERLAERQLGLIEKGTAVIDLPELRKAEDLRSVFSLVALPPPPPLAADRPVGGRLAELCRDLRGRLCLMGLGMMLVGAGLVLGAGVARR